MRSGASAAAACRLRAAMLAACLTIVTALGTTGLSAQSAAAQTALAGAPTVTPEGIAGLTDVRDVEISPDGRQILYVTQHGMGQRPSRSTIWIVAADGRSAARPLTDAASINDSPQWSPDGGSIAFLSNRSNPAPATSATASATDQPRQPPAAETSRQLWLISPAGGEARPLTSAGRDIRSFHWSPDGRGIAFLAPDPLTAGDRADRAGKRDWVEADAPRDLVRVWIAEVASQRLRRIAVPDREVSDLSWAPDGSRLALRVAATGGLNDFYYRSDLVILDVASGAVAKTIFKGVYSTGSWSPDGRRIAFTAPESDLIGTRGYVADVSTGTLRQLGATLNGSLKRLDWSRDNATVLARAIVHTRTVLMQVDVGTDRFRRLVDFPGQIRDFSVADDGTIALSGSQPGRAADAWVFRRGVLRAVSDVNPQMRQWRLGKVEEVRWTSSRDGKPIHGVLVTPPDLVPGVPRKTVVQPHGGPADVWEAGWLGSWTSWAQVLAARGYVVLLPNPRGSAGQGTAFARGVKGGWGDNDYQDVVDGVDMLVARRIADPARLGIGGWSYGGFLSAWAVTHDTRFKAAIVGAGVTDLSTLSLATDTPDWFSGYYQPSPANLDKLDAASPLRRVDRATAPVLVLHGQEDRRVPTTQGLAFYRGLRVQGKQASLVTYPREPHWISEPAHQLDVQRRVLAWFDDHL